MQSVRVIAASPTKISKQKEVNMDHGTSDSISHDTNIQAMKGPGSNQNPVSNDTPKILKRGSWTRHLAPGAQVMSACGTPRNHEPKVSCWLNGSGRQLEMECKDVLSFYASQPASTISFKMFLNSHLSSSVSPGPLVILRNLTVSTTISEFQNAPG